MYLRRIARVVHRWLSFALGVVLVLISLSGGVLVFAHPLDRWLNPQLFERSGEHYIGFDAAYAAVSREYPDAKVSMLWSPRRHGVYEAVLQDEPGLTVYIEPATGRILGARRYQESFVGWLLALHVSLLGGKAGESIVGCLGAALLLILSTGTFLWWPGVRKIRIGFRVRWHKNWIAAIYDLHKLTGVATLPLLLLIALTGFFLTFNTVAKVAVHGLTQSQPLEYPSAEMLRCPPTSRENSLRLEKLQRIAEEAIPGGEAMYFNFPAQDDRAVQLRLITPDSPHPYGFARVWINPHTGSVLHEHDPADFNLGNRLYAKWIFPLHIGTYAGISSKLLHAAGSFVPLLLVATGIYVWVRRRSKRHHSRCKPSSV